MTRTEYSTKTVGRGKHVPIAPDEVEAWFRDAIGSKNYATPPRPACERIADALEMMGDIHKRPRKEKVLGLSEKHARLFLRHLPAARAKLEKTRRADGVPTEIQAGFLMILAEMDAAKRHVENVLTLLDWPPSRPSWHETARLLHGLAWGAWLDAGKRPRSLNPDGPPVLFVQAGLARLGIHQSPESVSAALRDRRGSKAKTGT